MTLQSGDKAVVDIRKIRDDCLNPDHPEGKHKARVFAAVLNLTAEDSEELQVALLAAARNDEAREAGETPFGRRYTIDFVLRRQGMTATIRSGWRVPGELSVVGVDNRPSGTQMPVPLTAMDVPVEEIGRESIRYLLRRMNGADVLDCRTVIPVSRIVVRGSTAPVCHQPSFV